MMTHMDPKQWQSPPGMAVPGAQQTWAPQVMTPTELKQWQCLSGMAVPSGQQGWLPQEQMATPTDPRQWESSPSGIAVSSLRKSWLPQEQMMTPMDPRQWQWQCPPGTGVQQSWMAPEQRWGLAPHPAAEDMDREVAKPPLAGVLGRLIGTGTGQCDCAAKGQCNCEATGQCNYGGSKTVSDP